MEKEKKEYNVKPTSRQRKVVDILAEKGGTLGNALIEAGYSPVTAKTPAKVTESKGYKQLLEDHLPDNMILSALAYDIENKPKNRVKELSLAAKIKGMVTDRLDVKHEGNFSLSALFDASQKAINADKQDLIEEPK